MGISGEQGDDADEAIDGGGGDMAVAVLVRLNLFSDCGW